MQSTSQRALKRLFLVSASMLGAVQAKGALFEYYNGWYDDGATTYRNTWGSQVWQKDGSGPFKYTNATASVVSDVVFDSYAEPPELWTDTALRKWTKNDIGLDSSYNATTISASDGIKINNTSYSRAGIRQIYDKSTLGIRSGVTTGGTVEFNVPIQLQGNNTWDVMNNTLTVKGVISGATGTSFSLTKKGGGVLHMTAANTFTGGLLINEGGVVLGAGGTSGSLNSACTVTLATDAWLEVNRSSATTIGSVFGTGTIYKTGSSSLTTGSLGAADYSSVNFSVDTGCGLVVNQAADSVFGWEGVVEGQGSFEKRGTKKLIMNGVQTYSGGTIISQGTLLLDTGALPVGGALTMASGTRLEFMTDQEIGDLSITGNVTVLGGRLKVANTTITSASTASSTTATIDAELEGTGNLEIYNAAVSGSSITVNLKQANIHEGNTLLKSGTLLLSHQDALATSMLVKTGGTLIFNMPGSGSGRDVYNVGGLSGTSGFGLVTADGTTSVDLLVVQNEDATFSGVISGSGSSANNLAGGGLLKYGSGRLTLAGANTFNGIIQLIEGEIQIGAGATTGSVAVPYIYTWDDTKLIFNRSNDLTYSGEINKTTLLGAEVHKYGAGKLTLTGNSSFSAGFNLWQGTVAVGNSGALGSATGAINLMGGTVTSSSSTSHVLNASGASIIGGNVTFGDGTNRGTLTFNNNFDLQAETRTLTVATSTSAVLQGTISNGGINKAGAGNLTLGGHNTHGGATTVSAGTLRLANGNALVNSTLNMAGGALVFDAAAGSTTFNLGGLAATSSGTGYNIELKNTFGSAVSLVVGSNNESTVYRGVLSGTGSLVKRGTGTLTLAGSSNTFSGGIDIQSGTLQLGESVWDPISLSYSVGFNVSIASGARLVVKHAGSQSYGHYSYALMSGAGSIVVDGGNYAQGWYSTRQQYTGGTFITNGGTLFTDHSEQLPYQRAVTITGGTLNIQGYAGGGTGETIGALSISGSGTSAVIGSGRYLSTTGVAVDSSAAVSIQPNLQGTGGLAKSGAGALTLSGTSTYSGTTTVAAGSLVWAGANIIPDAGALSLTGGELQMGAYSETVGAVTLSGSTTASVAGTGTLTASSFSVSSTADTAVAANLAGSWGLQKSGTGTLTLSGANTFSGTTSITAGTVVASGNQALGTGSAAVTVSSGASLRLAGVSVSGKPLTVSGTGVGSAGALRASAGTNTWSGAVALGAGARINADAGASLSLTNASAISGSGYTLTVGGSGDTTIQSGIATGTGGLVKDGAGTLTLGGASSHTGATTVSAGSLNVTGTATGTAISVSGGATLRGTGTVGAVTLANAAKMEAGIGGVGSLATGDVTLASSAVANLNITNLAAYATSPAFSLGNLTFGSDAKIQLNFGGVLGQGTYGLLSYSGSLSSSNFNPVAFTGSFSSGSGIGTLDFSTAGEVRYLVVVDESTLIWRGSSTDWLGSTSWQYRTGVATGFNGNADATFDDTAASGAVSITANVGPKSLKFTGDTLDYTLTAAGGVVTSGSISKTGASTLTIVATNTYAGGTALASGRIRLGAAGALGSGSVTVTGGTLSSDGATARSLSNNLLLLSDLALGHATDSGALTLSGNVDLGADARSLVANSAVTISGVISNGALVKSGSGNLVLTNNNTYAGGTTVTNGTLSLGNATDTLADGGAVQVSGGTLSIGANSDTVGAVTLSSGSITGTTGTLTGSSYSATNASGTATISAKLGGVGGLTKTGAGTLTLSGANTYSGGTTIGGGTLSFANGALGSSGNVAVNGGTLQWASGNTQDISSRLVLVNGGSATLNTNGNSVTLATAIGSSTSSSLTKVGTGTLTLSGSSTYAGGTTVSAGTLELGHATDTLADGGAVQVSGGTLSIGANSDTVGAVTLSSGSITGTTGTLTGSSYSATNASGTATISAKLGGVGGLTKTGAGTLTLSGANTYSGGTTVSAGTLRASSTASLSGYNVAGGVVVASGATLAVAVGGSSTWTSSAIDTLRANATWSSATGSSLGIDTSSGNFTYGSSITTGGLTKLGSNTLTLTGTNSYGGTTNVSAGTLLAASASALSGYNVYGKVVVASGGTLAVAVGGSSTWTSSAIDTLRANATWSSATGSSLGIDTSSGNFTYGSSITTGGLTKLGSNTLTLTGTNSYSGRTVVREGILALGHATNTLSTTSSIDVDGGTLSIGANSDTVGAVTLYSGSITGTTGTLTGTSYTVYNGDISAKLAGTGSLTAMWGFTSLSAANTYTGGTTISGGTLSFASGSLGSSGTITVSDGTLQWASGNTQDISSRLRSSADSAARLDTNGNDVTLASAIFPSTALYELYKVGAGTLTLASTNSFTGPVYVYQGALQVGSGGTFGSVATSTQFHVSSGAQLIFNRSSNISYAGAVVAYGEFVKKGTGSLTLTNDWDNYFAGGITVESGNLVGTVYSLNGDIRNSGTVSMSAAAGTNPYPYSGDTFGFEISGTGNFTKTGTATVYLAGTNTYTGNTTISTGRLEITGSLGEGNYAGNIANSGTLAFSSYGQDQALAGNISGIGSLVLERGSLTLSGANTYSGYTTINGGTLFAASTSSLPGYGTTGKVRVAYGAMLVVSAGGSSTWTSSAIDSLRTRASWLDSVGSTLGIDTTPGDFSYGSSITTGALTKLGSNTLALTGSSTYEGQTTIQGGTLALGHATNTLSDASAVVISGGILSIGANSDTVGAVTLSSGSITGTGGTLTGSSYAVTNTTGTATISANLAGAGSLSKSGKGTLVLSGANSYAGVTTISAGMLLASSVAALPGYNSDGKVVVGAGATLALSAGGSSTWTASAVDAVRQNGTWASTSKIGFDTTPGDFTYGSAITTGGLTKLGANTLTLTGANSYTGGTSITAGALNFSGGSLGTTGAITVNGGALRWGSGNTQDISARLSLVGGGSATLDTNGNNVTLATAFGGSTSSSLTKSGNGTLTLSATNTYTGGTTVAGGTLSFADGSLGSAGNITIAQGTLQWASGNTQDISSRLRFANGGSAIVDTNGNNVTLATSFGGSTTSSLTKAGTGTLTLSVANTYTGGTTLTGGTLSFANGSLGSSGTITVSGGTLQWASGNAEDISSRLALANSGSAILDTNGNNVTLSAGFGGSTSSSLTKSGAGTLALAGANTYSGGTTVAGGTLSFADGSLGSAGNITVAQGTLQWAPGNTQDISSRLRLANGGAAIIDTNGNNVTLASAFGGSTSSSLTKVGLGVLSLSDENTYTGGTYVLGGTLVVNGHMGNGSLIIGSGAVLKGFGVVSGNTVISGLHAPSNSPGVQTFVSDLTYNGQSSIEWELTANTAVNSPVAYDQVVVGGNLAFTGPTSLLLAFNSLGSSVRWSDSFWDSQQNWLLYDVLGSVDSEQNLTIASSTWLDSEGVAFASARPNGTFALQLVQTGVLLTYTPIPEPSTYGLILGGLALAGAAVRRRRNAAK